MTRTSRTLLVSGCILAVGAGFLKTPAAQTPVPAPAPPVAARPSAVQSATSAGTATRETLDKYCVGCHNERQKIAGLMLDRLDVGHVADAAEQWEKVARKLRTQEMPPPGRPRPDASTYAAVSTALERALDAAAAAAPNPGRVPVHRL